MGNKHVTNITIKESSIHAVLQFSNSYQRDKQLSANQTHIQSPGMLAFMGLFYMWLVHWNARMTEMKQGGIEVPSCVRR